MDNILSSLDRLAELSDEELNGLKESVFTEYKSVKPKDETAYTVEVVDTLNQLADAKDAINAELSQRVAAASELAAAAEAATSRLEEAEEGDDSTVDQQPDEAAEEAPEGETTEKTPEEEDEKADKKLEEFTIDETPKLQEPNTDLPHSDYAPERTENDKESVQQGAVEAPEPVETTPVATEPTAKLPFGDVTPDSVEAAKATHDVPEEGQAAKDHPQSSTSHEARKTFAAEDAETTESSEDTVSNLNSFSAPEENAPVVETAKAVKTITASATNAQLTSLSQVAQDMVTKRHSIQNGVGANNEFIPVATIKTEFSEDRVLGRNDAEGNKSKIDAVVSPEAIVAAGGLTAPVETSYEIFELGETDARPVRDSLPKFNAERGGIRFLTSPTMDDLDGAVSVWTLADDIQAATAEAPNPVKPCLRVRAGEEVTVYVDAIPLCLTFGNLQTRAYPELVERHIKLGMVWHARFAEIRLLTRIGQLSTKVTAAASLGAARDILSQVEVAAAAYRNRYRISSETKLRVMFPEWFRNALRSDLLKQLPGDGRDGTFNLGEAEINSWFATRDIAVTWFIDGEDGQIFGAQAVGATDVNTGVTASASLMEFPEKLVWYLFSEGTFLFLDAGTLDLGLVRDSLLNGTNDYKIFLETFEGVAKVGQEALRIESALSIRGASSGTVDVPVTNSI